MGLMSKIAEKRNAPGPGVYKAPPEKGAKRFFFLLKNHFGKLIIINMVFVVLSIPVITIPANICALNRYLIKMVRDGYDFEVSDYLDEFKASFLRSIPFGLLFGVIIAYGTWLINISVAARRSGSDGTIPLVVGMIAILFSLLLGSYVFTLIPMLDLKNRYILRNSLILIFCDMKTSLKVLLITGISVFSAAILILYLLPWYILVLPICFFSWMHLMVCCAINPSVDKFIIKPFEAQQKAQESADAEPDELDEPEETEE